MFTGSTAIRGVRCRRTRSRLGSRTMSELVGRICKGHIQLKGPFTMNKGIEHRFTLCGPQDRAVAPRIVRTASGVDRLTGYGAVFFNATNSGTQYKLAARTLERILPGAFDRAIREDDVRGLFNHDQNHLLGRTSAGTMRLSVDSIGLR